MCYTCNAPGHKSPDCPKRRENVVGSSSSSNALDRTSRNLGIRSGEKPKKCNWVATNSDVPTISGKVNDTDAEFVVDTGAEITIVPGNLVYESQLLPDTVCVRGATGLPVTTNLARVEMCVLGKRFIKTVAVTSASMLCDKVLYSVPMGVQSAEKLLLDVCANEDGIGEIPMTRLRCRWKVTQLFAQSPELCPINMNVFLTYETKQTRIVLCLCL